MRHMITINHQLFFKKSFPLTNYVTETCDSLEAIFHTYIKYFVLNCYSSLIFFYREHNMVKT